MLACPRARLLEFAYNRLFVGPKPPVAPLYASAYLDPECALGACALGDCALGDR
ncbi:MAG: hypothetical protein Kow0092_21500 [Deferrisomatales bacterium]